jgi:hypothetical protein
LKIKCFVLFVSMPSEGRGHRFESCRARQLKQCVRCLYTWPIFLSVAVQVSDKAPEEFLSRVRAGSRIELGQGVRIQDKMNVPIVTESKIGKKATFYR